MSLWGSRWSACLPRLGLSAWLPASTGVTEPRGWVLRKQHVKVSIVPRHSSRPMERTRQAPHKYSLSTDPRAPTAHDIDRSEGLRSSRRVKQALGTLQSRRGLGGLRARGNWRPPLALRPDDQWAKSHRHIHCGWTPFYFMYDPKCSTTFPWCTINAPAAFAWCTIHVPAAFAWCTNRFVHKGEFSYKGWNGVHPLWYCEAVDGECPKSEITSKNVLNIIMFSPFWIRRTKFKHLNVFRFVLQLP